MRPVGREAASTLTAVAAADTSSSVLQTVGLVVGEIGFYSRSLCQALKRGSIVGGILGPIAGGFVGATQWGWLIGGILACSPSSGILANIFYGAIGGVLGTGAGLVAGLAVGFTVGVLAGTTVAAIFYGTKKALCSVGLIRWEDYTNEPYLETEYTSARGDVFERQPSVDRSAEPSLGRGHRNVQGYGVARQSYTQYDFDESVWRSPVNGIPAPSAPPQDHQVRNGDNVLRGPSMGAQWGS